MKSKQTIIIWLCQILLVCSCQNPKTAFIGFWEGPHPEDEQKKFYIHIALINDTIQTNGYWTNNGFYQESFAIDSVKLKANSLSFRIPGWNCTYQGTITDNNSISGGFSCTGEPFDQIDLVKNEEVIRYLVDAKPGASEEGYIYTYSIPEDSGDGLLSTRYRSSDDSLFIHSLLPEIIAGEYGRLNSLLLIRDDCVICEEYFFGYTKDDLHPIESCTKSVTSILVGIAKDQGHIKDLKQGIGNIFQEFPHLSQEEYREISILDLLTMSSGFEPDQENLFRSNDRIAYALNRDLIAIPGEKFHYDGGNTEILGGIIKECTGVFADEFAEKYLFEPLGIRNYNWEINEQEGYPSLAGSLHLCPRDMGKLGMLVLNEGTFSGKQIISADWIAESTSAKIMTHIPGDKYSYQWWSLNLRSGDKSYECIWANGWGSQFIYIFPRLNTVIVTTGCNYEGDSWAITNGISKYLFLLDN